MKQETIKTTLIYRELDKNVSADWFTYTSKKFISHIDTFYYSIKTVGDWGSSLGARSLISSLDSVREAARKDKEEKPFMDGEQFSDLVVEPYKTFGMYCYSITKKDCFDIFIAESVPGCSVSTLVVQLRSQYLWLKGAKDAYSDSMVYVNAILNNYGIQIADITENRIDFAYHTNYIQDMFSFFRNENLAQMAVHSFKRGGQEWDFRRDTLDVDYVSFGRRASNNAFVRIYNKTKEVVEKGYKQYFVPLWLEQGLISKFDKYIFDKIFEDGKQSWNYKEVARCRFYLEHGEDPELRSQIAHLLDRPDASTEEYRCLADLCVPDLTNIVNLEIQTKRKFYYDFVFPKIDYPKEIQLHERRIYKVLHMLQSIRDFITHETIRFVKYKGKYASIRRDRRPTADWWLRLSACGELDGISYDICKEYQKKFDVQRCKSRSLNSIATFASLLEQRTIIDIDDFSLIEDWSDIISYLNDNDLERYSYVRKKRHRELSVKYT